jgi:hypothetical protein
VVEHLPSHEVLSLNPSTVKIKKREIKLFIEINTAVNSITLKLSIFKFFLEFEKIINVLNYTLKHCLWLGTALHL